MSLSSRFHELLKDVDAALGIPLARRCTRAPRPLPPAPRDVLLVRLWGLGNLALLAPLFHVLRGSTHVRLLTLERNMSFVADQFPWVEPLPVPEPSSPSFLAGCWRVRARLRRSAPELVVDFETFLRLPLLLVRSATAAPIVGLDTPGQERGPLLDVALPHDPLRHVADTFAAIWRAAGLPAAAGPGPLRVNPALAHGLRESLPAGPGPLVVLHPGSGDHFPGRRWPAERFGRLARYLEYARGARVVLTGSVGERGLTRRVARSAATHLTDLSGRLDAGSLVALLSLADLLVSNDTGPLHVADAVGTRVVALYGPNTPHRYGPRRRGSVALFADLPCSPCLDDRTSKRSNCRHYACMQALGEQAVAAACLHALAQPPAPSEALRVAFAH